MGIAEYYNRFFHRHPDRDGTARHDPDNGDIDRPEQIIHLFKLLQEEHRLLSIHLAAEQGRSYSSSVLNVDVERQVILLDELNPKAGHLFLKESPDFRASTRLNGVGLRFRGRVTHIDEGSDIAIYAVPLPESVTYNQRRTYFRARPGPAQNMAVACGMQSGESYKGRLVDLSLGGLCIEFVTRLPETFHAGTSLYHCTIQLPDKSLVEADVEIRHVETGAQILHPRVGAHFVTLDPEMVRKVRHWVTVLDRERRKREARAPTGG